jgi:hypothetical protein
MCEPWAATSRIGGGKGTASSHWRQILHEDRICEAPAPRLSWFHGGGDGMRRRIKCLRAWRFFESSQHPMCPHVRQTRTRAVSRSRFRAGRGRGIHQNNVAATSTESDRDRYSKNTEPRGLMVRSQMDVARMVTRWSHYRPHHNPNQVRRHPRDLHRVRWLRPRNCW